VTAEIRYWLLIALMIGMVGIVGLAGLIVWAAATVQIPQSVDLRKG
jgi:hypothetical protein